MVTKKKVIKEPVKMQEKEKPKSNNQNEINFERIERTIATKYDLNWIGIREKIQSINIFKQIKKESKESDKKLKQSIKDKNIKNYLYWLFIEKYQLNLVWENYCKWWNLKFNKPEINNYSDYEIIQMLQKSFRR